MPLLHLWQEHFGFISDEGVSWIAAKLGLQPINILELVTFYPMFRQGPAGKTHIRVCRTLTCAMAGSYRVMENLCAATGIVRNHDANGTHNPVSVSADGNFSIDAGAHLTGQVLAGIVVVGGELQGNIESAKRVDVLEGGVIVGDVKAGSITVAAGSRMRGHVEFGWGDEKTVKLAGSATGGS